MKDNVWKIKVIKGKEKEFSDFCKQHNIPFNAYPKCIERTYKAKCEREVLLDIGHCIATIELMPKIILD